MHLLVGLGFLCTIVFFCIYSCRKNTQQDQNFLLDDDDDHDGISNPGYDPPPPPPYDSPRQKKSENLPTYDEAVNME